MCGIVGYIGTRKVVPILLEGLKRLEYRGYDSAGLVYLQDKRLIKHRAQGKLTNLEKITEEVLGVESHIGLGHTRWATHGAPTSENAHPHGDCKDDLVVVHNGIIENYQVLKTELSKKGHIFLSETDTEVIAHLIEEYIDKDLVQAVRKALKRVKGSFALGVLWLGQPDIIVAARNHSPLVLGINNSDGTLLASDVPALLPYTRKVVYLEDRELAVLRSDSWEVRNLDNGRKVKKKVQTITWNAGMAEKAGYKHFMLKEIYEQPQALINTLRGRIDPLSGKVELPEITLSQKELKNIERIALVACGTSWHAALVAKYWYEEWLGIPVEVDIGSEFRYRKLLLNKKVLTLSISQSGETADTLAGIRLASQLGSKVITICNVVGSTMTREADATLYTHAGPEIGVASTKAFTSQLATLFIFGSYLAQMKKTLPSSRITKLAQAIIELPAVLEENLPGLQQKIKDVAEQFYDCRNFLFVGRGLNFPIALEGALKLKEISYIHAEGYAAGELKHGPIALIDKDMPILGLVPKDNVYEKSISNIEEIKARQGQLILIGTQGDRQLKKITDHVLYMPKGPTMVPELNPILFTIPAQLLAYEIASLRGCDVDQPRNLAKSVTVE
ncbi:MAG: glutamine--fructose-6-phosphate transaminase (isomerizing) [Deltaproteobacteria bacterium]|jgi:glucosamine--fructose-6-phosphate aminotransferase (isomerizing)|nr:glutamine--fructose-6-phosphate transaminase (isomerizing) [Deltaproteobacteria bacterium]